MLYTCEYLYLGIISVTVCNCALSQNPGVSDVYTQHSTDATVARYAPSGYYIASGGML